MMAENGLGSTEYPKQIKMQLYNAKLIINIFYQNYQWKAMYGQENECINKNQYDFLALRLYLSD